MTKPKLIKKISKLGKANVKAGNKLIKKSSKLGKKLGK